MHEHKHGMMHKQVGCLSGLNEAWHGKVQQTILQVKWSSICNELHIDKTPHLSYLVRSRLGTQQY